MPIHGHAVSDLSATDAFPESHYITGPLVSHYHRVIGRAAKLSLIGAHIAWADPTALHPNKNLAGAGNRRRDLFNPHSPSTVELGRAHLRVNLVHI
jgi:hypothetical protein